MSNNTASPKTFGSDGDMIFEAVSEAILISQTDGIIVRANQRAEQLFQYAPQELVGQSIEILIPTPAHEIHAKHVQNFSQNPYHRQMGKGMELFARRSDGVEFPVEVSLSPTTIANQSYIIALIMDITQRKHIEAKIREAEIFQAIVDKERELIDLKGRLIAMISHEFRTPLTVIKSSTGLLQQYKNRISEEKHEQHLDRINQSVEKMVSLMDDVLLFTKTTQTSHFNPQITNIVGFCNKVCSNLNLTNDSRFRAIYEGELDQVMIDPKALDHILTNLLTNAQKYTDAQGEIELKVHQQGNTITFSISDTGIGISEDDQKRLFEPFYRGVNTTHINGTGLGLLIAKNNIELHGGTIELKSQLNKGTSVIFTLAVG